MAPNTEERILDALREGPLHAEAVGARLGIDKSGVRRHLTVMEHKGLVRSSWSIHGRGRPRRLFAVTEAGRETGRREYARLLSATLKAIVQRQGHEELHATLSAVAAEIAGPATQPGISDEARLRLLVEVYNSLGFDARLERKEDVLVLVQRNCPFLKVATDHAPALCTALDERAIRVTVPGARIQLLETMTRGAPVCRHEIRLAALRSKGT